MIHVQIDFTQAKWVHWSARKRGCAFHQDQMKDALLLFPLFFCRNKYIVFLFCNILLFWVYVNIFFDGLEKPFRIQLNMRTFDSPSFNITTTIISLTVAMRMHSTHHCTEKRHILILFLRPIILMSMMMITITQSIESIPCSALRFTLDFPFNKQEEKKWINVSWVELEDEEEERKK